MEKRITRLVLAMSVLAVFHAVNGPHTRAFTTDYCMTVCNYSADCNLQCLNDEGKGGDLKDCGDYEGGMCDVANWSTCHIQCGGETLCSQYCLDEGSGSTCGASGRPCDQEPNGICENDEYCNTDPEDCGSCGTEGNSGIGDVIKGEGVDSIYNIRNACDASSLVWSTVGNCPVSIAFASVPANPQPSCAARDAYIEAVENLLEFVMLLEYHIESLDLEEDSGDISAARQQLTDIVNYLLTLSCHLE